MRKILVFLALASLFSACSIKEEKAPMAPPLEVNQRPQSPPQNSPLKPPPALSVSDTAELKKQGYLHSVACVAAGEPAMNTESYSRFEENPFLDPSRDPLSTFSIDVDTASYANIRRFVNKGQRPPKDAVRIEELLNYFTYDDPFPHGSEPFSTRVELADCPWAPEHRLMRIGLKGREISFDDRRDGNYVFLLDVSGSMNDPLKLPLVKSSIQMLSEQLTSRDRVAIVVYAGAAGLVLPSTSATDRGAISAAIESLEAGGSTAGGEGIRLAYQIARDNFISGGINRVILATDGDFNVGVSSEGELTRLIEEEAKSGVFLTVLGFGTGNIKDSNLEKLADHGNGSYAYIDSEIEARKVLVAQAGGTLVTIAKDVKIQIEFNPAKVAAYRLIGYENRLLAAEDFNDDTKDAGEIGAGLSVTALYEIVPAGRPSPVRPVDPLKYSSNPKVTGGDELASLKLRYKEPDGDTSRLIEVPVVDEGNLFAAASDDLRFAAAVASFGLVLRDSPHKGDASLAMARDIASGALGPDPAGWRRGFIDLINKSERL